MTKTNLILAEDISKLTLCTFWFCNNLDEEKRAGCFAFIFFQISCYCKCSAALPHGAVGWTAVCDCGLS